MFRQIDLLNLYYPVQISTSLYFDIVGCDMIDSLRLSLAKGLFFMVESLW